MKRPLVVNHFPKYFDQDWKWLEGQLFADFKHIPSKPKTWLESAILRPDLSRYCNAYRAASAAKTADIIISHSPLTSGAVETARRLQRFICPHVAFSFNFTSLPQGIRRSRLSKSYQHITRFVTFSNFERSLYSEHFNIDPKLIDMVYWGVRFRPPHNPKSNSSANYLCAVGGEGRDYKTFLDAMRRLPGIPAVVVARPHNLEGLIIPKNVKVLFNLPLNQAQEVVSQSSLCVVPLRDARTPCGHVTLVNAMHEGKPIVATRSARIIDYVIDNHNALLHEPKDAIDLSLKIQNLWESKSEQNRLGENGKIFAATHCTEDSAIVYVSDLMRNLIHGK